MKTQRAPIDELTTPTRIYEALEDLGGGPIQHLGQNFLSDRPLLNAMVGDLRIEEGAAVLEIGPGLGHLTRSLLDCGARVLAVEKDGRLADSLAERLGNPLELEVLHRDILDLPSGDLSAWFLGERGVIAGNLPYYCSSQILVRLFEEWLSWVSRAGFLLQEEVVDRLVSPPRTKQYGRLSVLTQIFATAKKLRVVPPRLFTPKPEVSSAWCLMTLRDPAPPVSPQEISRITGVCFSERRKTLLNNLANEMEKDEARRLLEKAGIDGNRRPETLEPEEFLRLLEAGA